MGESFNCIFVYVNGHINFFMCCFLNVIIYFQKYHDLLDQMSLVKEDPRLKAKKFLELLLVSMTFDSALSPSYLHTINCKGYEYIISTHADRVVLGPH